MLAHVLVGLVLWACHGCGSGVVLVFIDSNTPLDVGCWSGKDSSSPPFGGGAPTASIVSPRSMLAFS